jgi:hypothetical protein
VPIRAEDYTGDDAAARRFVVSANQMRRHLNASQLGMVAAKFAIITHGGARPVRDSNEQDANLRLDRKTIATVGELFNISPKTISDARMVQNSGNQDLIDAVTKGDVKVSRAAKDVRANTPRPVRSDYEEYGGLSVPNKESSKARAGRAGSQRSRRW